MEPIVAIFMLLLGVWGYGWYRSGERKPGTTTGTGTPVPPGADHIPVRRIRDIHPDGVTVDLPGGPAWAVDAVRFRMAGSRVPSGKSAAEAWVLGRLRDELSKAIGTAKTLTLSGLSRQPDGTLSGTLWIDGMAVSAPVVDIPAEPQPPAKRETNGNNGQQPFTAFPAGFPMPGGYGVPGPQFAGYGAPWAGPAAYQMPVNGYGQPVNGHGGNGPQGVYRPGFQPGPGYQGGWRQ